MLEIQTYPHNEEAEQSVLGAIILEPNLIDLAMEKLCPKDFLRRAHELVFQAMITLRESKKVIDVVTLTEELQNKNYLEDVGSVSYITQLATVVPTSAHLEYYAGIVREKSVLRDYIKMSQQTAVQATSGKSLEEISASIQENVQAIEDRSMAVNKNRNVHIRSIAMKVFEKTEELSRKKSGMAGVSTGYVDLDKKLNGLNVSDLIVVAARPAMGKTAFALNIAANVAFKAEKPAIVFSLEMDEEQLTKRIFCLEGPIDHQSLSTGNMQDGDWERMTEVIGILDNSALEINETARTLSQIRSDARRFKREHGEIGVLVVDYLQLIELDRDMINENERISQVSRGLKLLAKELKCPIVALSQLSRAVEQRQDKRPMLSDLRASGSIEQDADIVMFLYRDDYYDSESERQNVAEVIISKHRNGPLGTVEFVFLKQYSKFLQLD